MIENKGDDLELLKAIYSVGIEGIEGVAIDEISMARVYSRAIRGGQAMARLVPIH